MYSCILLAPTATAFAIDPASLTTASLSPDTSPSDPSAMVQCSLDPQRPPMSANQTAGMFDFLFCAFLQHRLIS